jgi:hypothetical protein
MKSNTTFAIIAIAAVAALLIATTTTLLLTNDASAKKSFHETAAQSCVNQNARCQDLLSQIQGHDNAANVIGNQPTAAATPTPPTPTPTPIPTPEPAKLIVTKIVVCNDPGFCLLTTPNFFTIRVTGNNPDPSSFPGSGTGTTVTLGPGSYSVTEDPFQTFPPLTLTPTFSPECSGNIAAGETKNCVVTNTFTVTPG